MTKTHEFNEVLTKLTFLTKRNNLSNTEIGNAIDVERRAINGRADRNSKFKDTEIQKLESYFDVCINDVSISNNSGEEREEVLNVKKNAENFGRRLHEHVQEKNKYSDRQMARLLEIYEDDYIDLVCGVKEPNMRILNTIKANFEVSIDYLLYGE
mgnify:CR=1 FL=1